MNDIDELKKFCQNLSDESGKIIRQYFRTNVNIENKPDHSPVTIADKSAEEKMREMIMKEFPSHGIIGEEFGSHNEKAEYTWILDPIDGTKSFICGTVTFGTLIAIMKNGEPILGVINQPVLNEFLIGDNSVSVLNGNPVKVRKCTSLSEAVLLSSDHLNIVEYENINGFYNLMRKIKYH